MTTNVAIILQALAEDGEQASPSPNTKANGYEGQADLGRRLAEALHGLDPASMQEGGPDDDEGDTPPLLSLPAEVIP